jgi:hypothetical protein
MTGHSGRAFALVSDVRQVRRQVRSTHMGQLQISRITGQVVEPIHLSGKRVNQDLGRVAIRKIISMLW